MATSQPPRPAPAPTASDCAADQKFEISPPRCVQLFDFGCGAMRMRKEFHDLHPSEQDLYLEAVQALMRHNGGQTWLAVAEMHDDNFLNGIHYGSSFLPWHRAYLLDAENTMRSLDARFACVTIATWDAARAEEERVAGNREFSDADGILQRTGSLQHAHFTNTKTDYSGLNAMFSFQRAAYPVFQGDAFEGTSRTLEGNLHSAPHVYTRASMSSRLSPMDPLFLSHHGHVDKVWWMWQQCKQSRVTAFTRFAPANHLGADDNMVPSWVGSSHTPRQMLHAEANGYTYHINDFDLSKESSLHAASQQQCDSQGAFLNGGGGGGGGRRLRGLSSRTQVPCNHLESFADAITDNVCASGSAFLSSATTITIGHGSPGDNSAHLRRCCMAGAQTPASTRQELHAATIVAGILAGRTVAEAIVHAEDLVCQQEFPHGRVGVSAAQKWLKAKFLFSGADAAQQFVTAFNAGTFAAPCVTEFAVCDADCVASLQPNTGGTRRLRGSHIRI